MVRAQEKCPAKRECDSSCHVLDVGRDPMALRTGGCGEAGDIRATLERVGTTVIGPYDLLIAAQARRRGALLVTANTLEFIRVPGLKTADWALQN
jgi:tRNA(fMet)-specific endonuclease VapC